MIISDQSRKEVESEISSRVELQIFQEGWTWVREKCQILIWKAVRWHERMEEREREKEKQIQK